MTNASGKHTIVLLATWLGVVATPMATLAQRPFQQYETFYRDETSTRQYFDRFAISGEVSYNPARAESGEGLSSIRPDRVAYSARFDYRLADHFDIGVVVDAYGNSAGRSVGVSWVAFKYFRVVEAGSYALRLALDPASDGQGGFPQLDAAWIYSSVMSPEVTADVGFGARRVRVGYERLVPLDGPETPVNVSPILPDYGIIYARALGWEAHAFFSYKALFDPGGSHIFFSLLGEAGSYEMVDEPGDLALIDVVQDDEGVTEYRGGVIWLRSGLEFSRPLYAFTPFIELPIRQWAPSDGEWARQRLRIGLRLMLR